MYDGAASMSGELSGVQARITAHYPKAVYIHCFCHSLNLAVQDSSGKLPLIRKTLDTIQELSSHRNERPYWIVLGRILKLNYPILGHFVLLGGQD